MKLSTRHVVDGKDVTLSVYLKSADTMTVIGDMLKLGCESTVNIFCHSEVCRKINDVSTGYWQKPAEELADMFLKEAKANPSLMENMYYQSTTAHQK